MDAIFSKFVNNANNAMLDLQNLEVMSKKLSELKPGQKAVIKEFNSREIYLKLMEMGCLPGEHISINTMAPMGGPVSVNISGYTLSLRLDEAEHIVVDIIN